ncbi:hypothetical protein LXL04_039974 [Taraxacum kok-saghyz]
MMRSGVAVVLLPPCRLGLGRIRQAQFKDTKFKAFEALTLSVAFCSLFSLRSFGRGVELSTWSRLASATLGSPYGATHRSLRSSESHCSGPRIPMSEVEQLRSRWSRLDPRMSPLSSLGVITFALLSQDTLPGCSLLTGLVILVIECSAQQFKGTGEVSGSALVEEEISPVE